MRQGFGINIIFAESRWDNEAGYLAADLLTFGAFGLCYMSLASSIGPWKTPLVSSGY